LGALICVNSSFHCGSWCRTFSAMDGVMLAADTVSRPQEFMLAKRFVAEKIPVCAAELADDSVPLKSLLPAV